MAENELTLVNRVELRIALAESNEQFEASLKLYLAPILLKLASPHQEVRRAIFKMIQNLIPRINAAREIQLPVENLLNQAKAPNVSENSDSSSVVLYSLLFVSKGVERLNDTERFRLIPLTIENISKYPSNISSRLFHILGKLLQSWVAPKGETDEYNSFKKSLKFEEHPDDEKYLADHIAKFLLLHPMSSDSVTPLPGLSMADIEFFTKSAGVTYNEKEVLNEMKKRYLELLKVGFKDLNLVIPLLIASTDNSSAIKDMSDILFKKLKFDIEDETIIEELLLLFGGSIDRSHVDVRLQDRILNVLLKSRKVCQSQNLSEIVSLGLSSSYSKLKQTTIQFIKWLNLNSSGLDSVLSQDFNSEMFQKIKDSLLSEGWPRADSPMSSAKDINQRQLQYEALGNILRSTPSLFQNDFSPILFLFDSLEGEISDMRSTVQDGLSGLTVHLSKLSNETKSELKTLVKKYMEQDLKAGDGSLHSCRYMSVKFCNLAFPFHDAQARYFCILGTIKDNKSETIEESLRGLHPYVFNLMVSSNRLDGTFKKYLGYESNSVFPSFSEMVGVLSSELTRFQGYKGANIYKALGKAIEFTVESLVMQVIEGKNTVITMDENWRIRLEKALESDMMVQELLINGIDGLVNADSGEGNPYLTFIRIVCDCYLGQYLEGTGIIPNTSFGGTLSLLLSFSPSVAIKSLTSKATELQRLINSRFQINAKEACKAFGIIASHPSVSNEEISDILNSLISEAAPNYSLHNRYLSIAYLISRLTLRGRIELINAEYLEDYLKLLHNGMKIESLYPCVLECVTQLCLYGTLGPVLNDLIRSYVYSFIDGIKEKVKRCDELSVLTLGYLSLCVEHSTDVNFELLLFETHISKQVEFTFSTGEAFVIYSCGWDSKFLTKQLDIQGESCKFVPKNLSKLPSTVNLILDACSKSKPSLRKSGCIWLLSLVQYCGHLEYVKRRAPEIHLAFMRFLADRDELVQESASRGLGIVYEMGDYQLKDTLVHNLLKSFSDSSATNSLTSGTVEHDTELFDQDLLKTHEGSVSTYKDVLNLASDVGDPSLVYKFMSLSKSSMLWSSRKGMAFGLGSIMSKASLSSHLDSNKRLFSRLIPKLFRYKFDPNPSVSQSMNDIWNALVDNSSKVIEENFDIILQELLNGMGNKEWRVRQGSTSALNEMLLISSFEKYEINMDKIWNMSFRVMDDIKDSVRKEGNKLTKSLATTTLRAIETDLTKSDAILSDLIPFLMGNRGLLSDSEEVKDFSLKTILKLCDMKSKSLQKFVPSLVESFIGLMSSLEPDVVNYLILNADKYNLNNSEIDAKRLQGLGASPIMDAIENLLDLLKEEHMGEFISRIQKSIKGAVGLPSKVCGSRVLVSMVSKRIYLVKPYSDTLLKLCILQITDRNNSISSSYSIAAGYLSKIASIPTIISYSKTLQNLYFECEDESHREIATIAIENISKFGGEVFQTVLSAFLPIIYVGKHDSDEIVRHACERVWIENTSGGSSAVKLFLDEIVEICKAYLESYRYDIRQILARSIIDLCNKLEREALLDKFNLEFLEILVSSCKRKSWDGKELLLEALVMFSIKCKEFLYSNPDILETISRAVLTEAKRKTKRYQKHSVKLLGKFISVFPDNILIENYTELITYVLSEEYEDEDEMEIDTKGSANDKNIAKEEQNLIFINNILTSMGEFNNGYNNMMLDTLLTQINKLLESENIALTWRTKLKICGVLTELVDHLGSTIVDENESRKILKNWERLEENCTSSENTENVYIAFIRLSGKLISYFTELNYNEYVNLVKDSLRKLTKVNNSVVQVEIEKLR